MERKFQCPFCEGQLYLNDRIVFSGRKSDGSRGLILLTPELGDYLAMTHPEFPITDGEHIDFLCPLCRANFMIKKNEKKYTRINMIEKGDKYDVLFSQIAGEKCTYVIGEQYFKVFGVDADHTTNFWGHTPNF